MQGNECLVYTQCCRVCNGTGVERMPSNAMSTAPSSMIHGARHVRTSYEERPHLHGSCGYMMNDHAFPQGCEEASPMRRSQTPKAGAIEKREEYSPVFAPLRNGECGKHGEGMYMIKDANEHGYCQLRRGQCGHARIQPAKVQGSSPICRQLHPYQPAMGEKHMYPVSALKAEEPCGTVAASTRATRKQRENVDCRLMPAKVSCAEPECCAQRACGSSVQAGSRSPGSVEHFFTSYVADGAENDNIDDEVYDIADTNFDFRTLSGYGLDDEVIDPAAVSIIDMVCGIPEMPEEPMSELPESLHMHMPMPSHHISPEPLERSLYEHIQSRQSHSASKKSRSPKKTKGGRAHRDGHASPSASSHSSGKSSQGSIPAIVPGADALGSDENVEWYPGFSRQLGAKGRSAILDLVRRVYRQDPDYYKSILQARNPPSSISNLPFFNIPMLWELTHQFGVFKQAILLHKNQQSAAMKNDRNRTKAKADKHDRSASVAASSIALASSSSESLVHGSAQQMHHSADQQMSLMSDCASHESKRMNVQMDGSIALSHAAKYQKVKGDALGSVDPARQGFTSFSGRSIKPSKRYVDYEDDYRRPARDMSPKSGSSDSSLDLAQTLHEPSSPSLTRAGVNGLTKTAEGSLDGMIGGGHVPPLSLVWCVTQKLVQKNMDANGERIGERMSPVSSARSTPTRCISV